jgi:hypothetical protein
MRALLAAGVLLIAIPRIAHPFSLPSGFVDEVVVSGVSGPVHLEFDRSGGLMIETHGTGWIVKDASGVVAAAGIYFVVVEVDDERTTRKLTLLR